MYSFEDFATIVGAFCTFTTPYSGFTEGYITRDFGNEVVVQLTNGKELTVYRSDIIIMD
jgi:hypothetical protein